MVHKHIKECALYIKNNLLQSNCLFFFVEFSNLEKRDIKVEVKIEEK